MANVSGINLEHIHKKYGPVVAVGDVSLTVNPQEFVTLLGPSGSGKTTTLRMIAGLEQPDSGTIRIGDRMVFDQHELVPTNRRNLGMVFQSYAVWPHKTVFENVAFPLKQRGVNSSEQQRRVFQMLEMVELNGLDRRYPSELSGGQQQRVALARALVGEPEVVLFDEPLSNLDAQLRESMRNLLLSLHKRFNFTAVYVTHDQIEAMVLSDRVYVMNKGAIVQSGTPKSLYERPESLFVAEFIGQANVLPIAESMPAENSVRLRNGLKVEVATLQSARKDQLRGVLVIRPHCLQFVRAGITAPGTGNLFKAKVKQAVYLGDRARYVLDLGANANVTMELVIGPGLPDTDDEIQVRLPPEDCVVI